MLLQYHTDALGTALTLRLLFSVFLTAALEHNACFAYNGAYFI